MVSVGTRTSQEEAAKHGKPHNKAAQNSNRRMVESVAKAQQTRILANPARPRCHKAVTV
jgi:hypothetical protein